MLESAHNIICHYDTVHNCGKKGLKIMPKVTTYTTILTLRLIA